MSEFLNQFKEIELAATQAMSELTKRPCLCVTMGESGMLLSEWSSRQDAEAAAKMIDQTLGKTSTVQWDCDLQWIVESRDKKV